MKVTVRLDPEALTAALNAPEAARRLAEGLLERSAGTVPLDTGALRDSGSAAPTAAGAELRYTVPYAAYQYNGISPSGAPLHYQGAPERGSRWVSRAWEAEGAALLEEMKKNLGR